MTAFTTQSHHSGFARRCSCSQRCSCAGAGPCRCTRQCSCSSAASRAPARGASGSQDPLSMWSDVGDDRELTQGEFRRGGRVSRRMSFPRFRRGARSFATPTRRPAMGGWAFQRRRAWNLGAARHFGLWGRMASIARQIGSPVASPGHWAFMRALARWQRAVGMRPTGLLTRASVGRLFAARRRFGPVRRWPQPQPGFWPSMARPGFGRPGFPRWPIFPIAPIVGLPGVVPWVPSPPTPGTPPSQAPQTKPPGATPSQSWSGQGSGASAEPSAPMDPGGFAGDEPGPMPMGGPGGEPGMDTNMHPGMDQGAQPGMHPGMDPGTDPSMDPYAASAMGAPAGPGGDAMDPAGADPSAASDAELIPNFRARRQAWNRTYRAAPAIVMPRAIARPNSPYAGFSPAPMSPPPQRTRLTPWPVGFRP